MSTFKEKHLDIFSHRVLVAGSFSSVTRMDIQFEEAVKSFALFDGNFCVKLRHKL